MYPLGADPSSSPEVSAALVGMVSAFISGFFLLLTALVKRHRVIVHRHEQVPGKSGTGALGVLLLLIAAVIGGVFLYQEDEHTKQAQLRLNDLDSALQKYRAERGFFPRTLEELVAQGGPDGGHFLWRGYAGLYDPWGKHFDYYPDDVLLNGRPRVQTVRKFLGFGDPRTLRN